MASIYVNLLEQKKAFAWEKSWTPRGLVRETNMAAISSFWDTNMAAATSCENTLSGSLSNDDGDVTENGKKSIGFDKEKKPSSARASRFNLLYISSPSVHNYDMKMFSFTFCGGHEHKTTTKTFFYFSWTLELFRIQLQEKFQTFDELNEME